MQKILAILNFNFKTTIRNWKANTMMFVLPIIFMAIFGFAYAWEVNEFSFNLGIHQGPEIEIINDRVSIKDFIKKIDNEAENLSIELTLFSSRKALEEAVLSEKVDLGLDVVTNLDTRGIYYETIVRENETSFGLYRSVIYQILVENFLNNEIVGINNIILDTGPTLTGFDLLVPGLIVYGLLTFIPGIAQSFALIRERKYLFRFATSKVSSLEIVLGNLLFFLLIGVGQVTLLYLVALAFGFQVIGNPLIAFIPALFTILFVIGVGLLLGAYVNKTTSAGNLGTILAVVLGFFSGSFIYGIGSILEWEIFGYTLQFNDILPSKWGVIAINKILIENKNLNELGLELLILFLSASLVLILSSIIYSYKQIRNRI